MPINRNKKIRKNQGNTGCLGNDKGTFHLPRQYTVKILKHPKNKGIEGAGFEIYTFFTPLETRKPKRKTIPIDETRELKVPLF